MQGLYIHVPICSGKCRYCDFYSRPDISQETYLSALERELALRPASSCETLYVGGGTPSQLTPENIARLCALIEKYSRPIHEFTEAAFEANPESVTAEKAALLKKSGFTRVSMGLQAYDDKLLSLLGRRHTVSDFLRAWEDLRRAGFDNLNLDLIANVPSQSLEDFIAGAKRALALLPEHVSFYSLQIEEGTAFWRDGVRTDDDLARAMYDAGRALLKERGFIHYEISNFSLPGRQSLHNINYWKNGPYMGFGPSAASYENGVRKSNTADFAAYSAALERNELPVDFSEQLTGMAKLGESIMLGLRLLDGIEITAEINEVFGPQFTDLARRGLIALENGKASLSDEGLYLSNQVFSRFVEPF